MREIQILPAVLGDIADAAAWYDEDGYSGLGDRFIATFIATCLIFRRMEAFIGKRILIFTKFSSAHSHTPFITDSIRRLGLSPL